MALTRTTELQRSAPSTRTCPSRSLRAWRSESRSVIFPEFGGTLRPLGDAFIRLIQMVVGPVIFCSVVAAALRSVGEHEEGGARRHHGADLLRGRHVSSLS